MLTCSARSNNIIPYLKKRLTLFFFLRSSSKSVSPSTPGKANITRNLGNIKKILVYTPTLRKSEKILFSVGYEGKESNQPKKQNMQELLHVPNTAKVHTCIKLCFKSYLYINIILTIKNIYKAK